MWLLPLFGIKGETRNAGCFQINNQIRASVYPRRPGHYTGCTQPTDNRFLQSQLCTQHQKCLTCLRSDRSFSQIMSFSYSVCILEVLNCLKSRLERSSISAKLRKCFRLSEFVIVLQLFFSDIFQVFPILAEMTFLGIAGRLQENIRSTTP
jgi:hypothetical protein